MGVKLVSHTEGRTQAEGVQELDAEEDIWASEGQGKKGVETTP
jgi:hypothetical protein